MTTKLEVISRMLKKLNEAKCELGDWKDRAETKTLFLYMTDHMISDVPTTLEMCYMLGLGISKNPERYLAQKALRHFFGGDSERGLQELSTIVKELEIEH